MITGNKSDERSVELRAYTMIVVASFIFSSNHVLARYLHDSAPPMGIIFWRVAIGTLVLLPIAAPGLLRRRHLVLKHWKLFVLMGALFVPLGNGVIYVAYNWTTALNGSVVSTAQPAVVVFLSWLLFRDLINTKQAAGVVVAAVGVLIIITRGEPAMLLSLEPNLGDMLMLASVVSLSFYSILIRRVPHEISIPEMMLALQFIGMLMTLPLYLAESRFYKPMPFDAETIGFMLWIGIAITTLAVALSNSATRLIGANKASILNYIRSSMAALLAIVLLGETLYPFHIVALALVIGGVYLMTRGRTPAL